MTRQRFFFGFTLFFAFAPLGRSMEVLSQITDNHPIIANGENAKLLIPDKEVIGFLPTPDGTVYITKRGLQIYQTGSVCGFKDWEGSAPLSSQKRFMGMILDGTKTVESRLVEKTPSLFHFFRGDPSTWQTHVPGFKLAEYHLSNGSVIYLQPSSSHVKISYSGKETLILDWGGPLTLETTKKGTRLTLPNHNKGLHAFSDSPSTIFELTPDRKLKIRNDQATIETSTTIVISWGSFFGGSGGTAAPMDERASTTGTKIIALSNGDVMMAGKVYGDSLPTTSSGWSETYLGSGDIFVTKISPDAGEIVFSTYLGGSWLDECHDLTVDEEGDVFLVGRTKSSDYPISPGSYDTEFSGSSFSHGWEGFITKLSGETGDLLISTFSNLDEVRAIDLDRDGNMICVGNRGNPDVNIHVLTLSSDGNTALMQRQFGGTEEDRAADLAVDEDGRIWVTGFTRSPDFPFAGNGIGAVHAGNWDVFLTCLSSNGETLIQSLVFGGGSEDIAYELQLKNNREPCIVGYTCSYDYGTTPGCYDDSYNGKSDGFVSQFDQDGNLIFSTFLGGTNYDFITSFQIDSMGQYVLCGTSSTPDLFIPTLWNGGSHDAFVATLTSGGEHLPYATYLGGDGFDLGMDVTLWNGHVILIGSTNSGNFPITEGNWGQLIQGASSAFLSYFSSDLTILQHSRVSGSSLGFSEGKAMTLDSQGNPILLGRTQSLDFPVTQGALTHLGGIRNDVTVTKWNKDGSQLLFSCMIGGWDDDVGTAIELDSNDAIVISGQTLSPDFPISGGGFGQNHPNGHWDGWVMKLTPQADALIFSNYFGGANDDEIEALHVGANGSIYVAGSTKSKDFPLTEANLSGFLSSSIDAFLAVISQDGTETLFSTYLGGSNWDTAQTITTDSNGRIYVAGHTLSSDFPGTNPSVYDSSWNGDRDVFLATIDLNPLNLISTFIGGSGPDLLYDLEIDPISLNPILVGCTQSSDFPTSVDAFSPHLQGQKDGFICKVSSDLSSLMSSTFLGGEGHECIFNIKSSASGNVYVVGQTSSSSFPLSPDAFQNEIGGLTDGFYSILNSGLTTQIYGTFVGGTFHDVIYAMDWDPISGRVFVLGWTESPLIPEIQNGLYPNLTGRRAMFLLKMESTTSFRVFPSAVAQGLRPTQLEILSASPLALDPEWVLDPINTFSGSPLDLPIQFHSGNLLARMNNLTQSVPVLVHAYNNFDLNSDGKNSIKDLYYLLPSWTGPLMQDPNNDRHVDIRDFLYISIIDRVPE